RLQHWLYSPGGVGWWEVPITLTYISHFFVPFVVAAVFWVRDRSRYWRYVRRFVSVSFAAALTFVLYPAIPPWMAARFGVVDPIVRTAPRGWGHRWIHLDIAQDVIRAGWDTANLVAAVPSLHAGYTALVAVMLWPTARPSMRVLLAVYATGMGFVLVLTGEHYVFDVLIGWAYVAVVCLLWNRLERHPVPFWRRMSPRADVGVVERSEATQR
ncbi:MAG: phosphatase PAP2 family protein, partial [Acidimicrobiales bacterium]